VFAKEKPQQDALKINGLRAVFGEKYPAMVRVVSIGADVEDLIKDPGKPDWRKYSIEFCGGTHVANSGEIENFAITAEESVSKGIRRLVALSGDAAGSLAAVGKEVEDLIAKSAKTPDQDLQPIISRLQQLIGLPISLRAKRRAQAEIAALQARYRAYEKQAAKSETPGAGKLDAAAEAGKLIAGATDLAGGKLIIGQIAGANGDLLRSAIDSLRKKAASHAIMLACAEGESATFVAAVSDDLVAKGLKAGDWVKKTAAVAGGGGGGRPQMAQGSGKDAGKIGEALKAAQEMASGVVPQ
jgi:alanyl-tRNA synthetase